jgi:propanol-preferring alcohol dehydrogenase
LRAAPPSPYPRALAIDNFAAIDVPRPGRDLPNEGHGRDGGVRPREQGRQVYAFARPGDRAAKALAVELGVRWVGESGSAPPEVLDASILYAPVGALVPEALRSVAPGGTVVCAGIHMSDIPSFSYELLWSERCVRSVANLTRKDGEEFLALAARMAFKNDGRRIRSLGR